MDCLHTCAVLGEGSMPQLLQHTSLHTPMPTRTLQTQKSELEAAGGDKAFGPQDTH